MKNMNTIEKNNTRELNGGNTYRCIHCGYTSTSYAKTYANALVCVTKKYGGAVWRVASAIFG